MRNTHQAELSAMNIHQTKLIANVIFKIKMYLITY